MELLVDTRRVWTCQGFPGGAEGKNLPANARDARDTGSTPGLGRLPGGGNGGGWEDFLEEEMATYSRIRAWEIPQTEKPGGLLSMGSQRVGRD